MIEIYSSVELTWGAPDLAQIQSNPFTTRMMLEGRPICPSAYKKMLEDKASKRGRVSQSRPVIYLDERFESIKDAAEAYGCSASKIYSDVNRGRAGCSFP